MVQMDVARMKSLKLILAAVIGLPAGLLAGGSKAEPVKYYLDSHASPVGSDGTKEHPWTSLKSLDPVIFQPGDIVLFKRGSSFEGGFEINQSGTSNAPIIFRPYGEGAALPRFTNPQSAVWSGNAIRLN